MNELGSDASHSTWLQCSDASHSTWLQVTGKLKKGVTLAQGLAALEARSMHMAAACQ